MTHEPHLRDTGLFVTSIMDGPVPNMGDPAIIMCVAHYFWLCGSHKSTCLYLFFIYLGR